MSESPYVFISYSYDSPGHVKEVLRLSNLLRSEGVDCVLDQYEVSPPEGWPRWMDKKIRDAKYVVLVCTETYYKRVMGEEEPGTGLGVRWEGNLIYQHLYNAGSHNTRFIPVIMERASSRFVPTPIQGSTIYCLDTQHGYEQLLARLTETVHVEKATLGKKRALPEKPVKTNPTLYITSPIDVDLWNKARWSATFFLYEPNRVPSLGLAFQDEASARKIFEGWHERYGDRDLEEELRISIIEGDIPGEAPGYSVHVGTEVDVFIKRLKQSGYEYSGNDTLGYITRINRMNPPAKSTNLQRFKNLYRHFKTYYLIPGILAPRDNGVSVKPIPELTIFKSKLYLRHVSDVGENDIDRIVLDSGTVPRPKNQFRV